MLKVTALIGHKLDCECFCSGVDSGHNSVVAQSALRSWLHVSYLPQFTLMHQLL